MTKLQMLERELQREEERLVEMQEYRTKKFRTPKLRRTVEAEQHQFAIWEHTKVLKKLRNTVGIYREANKEQQAV